MSAGQGSETPMCEACSEITMDRGPQGSKTSDHVGALNLRGRMLISILQLGKFEGRRRENAQIALKQAVDRGCNANWTSQSSRIGGLISRYAFSISRHFP